MPQPYTHGQLALFSGAVLLYLFALTLRVTGGISGAADQDVTGRKKVVNDADTIPAEMLIADLQSGDGVKRVAVTQELFRRGKAVADDLKKAGAKQVATQGTISSGRLDVVYSLIEGLRPSPPQARAGYLANSFGLHVEKGTTPEEVGQMGKRHGFSLTGTYRPDSAPNCYVTIARGKSLTDVLSQVLASEPKVITVNLNYFEK